MNPKALHKISYGLYIVSSAYNGKLNGQIANALFQVTAKPQTIAVSINKENLTHEYISKSKTFSVAVLNEKTPMKLIGTFGFKSGRDLDKFKECDYKIGKTKCPMLKDFTIAYFEANVKDQLDVGTHTIFIGEVVDAEILSDEKPMTYEYYHQVKGGYSPKTAPTYVEDMDKPKDKKIENKEEKNMDKYVCDVCGYIYDPEKGDSDNGIDAGTAFEDLPDDWVCPLCGAPKSEFSKQE